MVCFVSKRIQPPRVSTYLFSNTIGFSLIIIIIIQRQKKFIRVAAYLCSSQWFTSPLSNINSLLIVQAFEIKTICVSGNTYHQDSLRHRKNIYSLNFYSVINCTEPMFNHFLFVIQYYNNYNTF